MPDKAFESAEILRRLFEAKRVAMVISDKSGNIIRVSPGFEIATGYTAEELKLSGWHRLTHPDDLALDQAFVNRCLEGEISGYTINKRYVHKDGHSIHCTVTVILVNGGVIPRGLFVATVHFPSLCAHPCVLPEGHAAEILEVIPRHE